MSLEVNKTRLTNYVCTWNDEATVSGDKVVLETIDEVDLSELDLQKKEIKVGAVGDALLGERIIGMEGAIKVQVRAIDLAIVRKLTPWAPSSGPVPATPAGVNVDLYQYAKRLRLHPIDKTDASEDVVFLKTVPMIPAPFSADGVEDNVLEVTFAVYLDRGQLPDKVYYYTGGLPA
jgi:hypothetical protein